MGEDIVFCVEGILLPFAGTALGAACVFFGKRRHGKRHGSVLNGFSAGVMLAASIWSLLIPALEYAAWPGALSVLPALGGCLLGFLFLRLTDRICLLFRNNGETHNEEKQNRTLFYAITLHNLPEGMAVGIIWAGFFSGRADETLAGAFALSLGIAIQNVPEGAIVSLPLSAAGRKNTSCFLIGVASGAVEPVGSLVTLLMAESFLPLMPWFLGFAAGAMLCAVVADLIPAFAGTDRPCPGIYGFFSGFLLMMALDNIL